MLLICYGTRPEYLKVKPLIEELSGRMEFRTLFTGQHVDLVDEKADFEIDIKDGMYRLNSFVSSIMDSFDFKRHGITKVLVQGDTTSAFTVALSAFYHKIPVIHLEAGLRTYNLLEPYPEEANRQMISRITALHLCPTALAQERLEIERAPGQMAIVGNTVLDNLCDVEVTTERCVLVTMHRRENQHSIAEWFQEIDKVAAKYHDYEFLLPIHPNPAVRQYQHLFRHVKVVEPLGHAELVAYLAKCTFVITDSGGVQEESAFLDKPCLVCRKETERTEGLNNFSLLCEDPSLLLQRVEELKGLPMKGPCPYGQGDSAQRIVKILEEM